MKLKKIASLMLAGVMAVSMLAGCSGKGNDSNNNGNNTTVDTSVLGVDGIVSLLDEDTTKSVKFSADNSLQNALNKVVSEIGTQIVSTDMNSQKSNIVERIVEVAEIENFQGGNQFALQAMKKKDADPQTLVDLYIIPAADMSEKMANNVFASDIDDLIANVNIKDRSSIEDDGSYYKFSFNSNVAAVKVMSTDGFAGYVAVVTLICTSAEAKV